MKPIHIFKAGTYTPMSGEAVSFSDADLAAAAAAYDPSLHEAPLVTGHPEHDAPAYGWVEGLDFADGQLVARTKQVHEDFETLVKDGRFKKVSASFFAPDHPSNPKPGAYYLRHVGFLGAKAPAVKGLRPIEFAAGGDGVVEFALPDAGLQEAPLALMGGFRAIANALRSVREWFIEREGAETADKLMPSYAIEEIGSLGARLEAAAHSATPSFADPDPAPTETTMSDAAKAQELADKEAELKKQEEALKKQRLDFAETEKAARRKENAAQLDGLIGEGRLAPGLKDSLLDFMDGLDHAGTLDFGAGGAGGEGDDGVKATPLAFFRDLLAKSGKVVEFAEVSADDDAEGTGASAGVVSFAAPDNHTVDPRRLEIHRKAVAYAAKHDVPYLDAVVAVGG